jgi:hypothetical protein
LASAYSLCERFSASICLLLERGLHEDIGRSLYKQAAQEAASAQAMRGDGRALDGEESFVDAF